MQRRQSEETTSTTKDPSTTTEIQMQAFNDGLPPPPPVSHSWKRIDRWTEDNYEELWDNIGEGCTQNDINELEHELDCTLPMEVRESLQVHDGQERGGRPTGVLFSSMLLDCEEIVHEWQNWQKVNEDYLSKKAIAEAPQQYNKAFDGAPSSSANPSSVPQSSTNPNWREDLLSRQDSQPPNAIKKAYAHPAWIPLARDWGGNNLAVDLSPGPAGKWGQVILMGRDYDCKFVVSRSWAALLANIADDMSTSKVYVDEESGEMKLREFKNASPAYLDILRWRADQKYGRKPLKQRPGAHIDTRNAANAATGRASPYASPTASDADRGRSSQRFPPRGVATSSPRGSGHVSSPLARVAEETPAAVPLHINSSPRREAFPRAEKLVSTNSTPRQSVDTLSNGSPVRPFFNKENFKATEPSGLGMKDMNGVQGHDGETGADEMKNVEF